jgi:hypothetical protein
MATERCKEGEGSHAFINPARGKHLLALSVEADRG